MIVRNSSDLYLDELVTLEAMCFQEEAWSRDQILSHFTIGNGIYFQKNKIISYIFFVENPWELDILRVATHLEYRKKGFAGDLLLNLQSLQKQIHLEVNVANFSAIQFYKKYGFKEIGLRKKYYKTGEDACCMTWENRNGS
jgi:[ribosomal protein S18]-alanine N-acetyltransferase